jgi:hypothetical protein
LVRLYRHLLSISVTVLSCYVLYRQDRAQTCGCVTLFVVVSITENDGMTMETWENLYRKTNIVEVEEKWVLCPGKVIFEHPTELTNTFMAVSRV